MGGRYDIAQRVKEMLEASDPRKYGDTEQARSIELSPPVQRPPDPHLTALATPLIPAADPPPTPFVAPAPPLAPLPPPPTRPTAAPPITGPIGPAELAELVALLRDGRKIMAVKRYRELTGAGLADAKAAVESLELRAADRDLTLPPAPRAAPAPAPLPAAVPDWLQPVVTEVRRGNKIAAIKAYRDATGVGLAAAKATVEGLERQLAANPTAAPAPARQSPARDMDLLAEEVVRLVQRGQKIEAIKRYREVTNCGLSEAKEAVETIEERLNTWPR